MPSRLRYLLILLTLYWAGSLFLPYLRSGETYLTRNLSSLLFLIVDLFYLPVAIGLSRKARKAGWIMMSFFLVKKLVFALFQITTEIVSPTEFYSHPDSFFPVSEGERRVEIWLMLLTPLVIWIVMLRTIVRIDMMQYFAISRSMGSRVIVYSVIASLLYRLILLAVFSA